MKRTRTVSTLSALLFLGAMSLVGCKEGTEVTDVITLDVNADYPKKELVLQDFMEVEYIPLETNDEFVTQGDVIAIGEKYILTKNWTNDGDIFVFDRKSGKGIKKINRRGQGGEEYNFINGVILDEENKELFVNSSSNKKIFVYDFDGNFKRCLNHAEGAEYLNVLNYDKEHLICYDMSIYYEEGKNKSKRFYHAIISKQDGSIKQEIVLPFDIVKAPFVQKGDAIAVASVRPIIPNQKDWLLVETSSDTVYNYISKENKLIPFLVKTPSKDPEILLTIGALTERYCFIQTIKKIFDFTKGRGFPTSNLMYDKQEKALFEVTVLNGDFEKKTKLDMTSSPINGEIITYQTIAANRLVEAYKNNGLRGQLKEIASQMDEESNPVIMLLKSKR